MSLYNLVQRFVITADETDAAGVSPKDVVLGTTVKSPSTFLTNSIRDIRKNVGVQRGIELIDNPDTTPRNVVITAVVLAASKVEVSAHEVQTGTAIGVRARLTTTTNLELTFTNPGAGDSIDVAWEVIQYMQPRGATVRLLDADTVRLEWDGVLVAGEQITAAVEVWDIENLGDDIKEILFRQSRILAFHGENTIEDLIKYDDAGNPVTYRIRTFNSKANAEAATLEIPDSDPLEVGECTRVGVIQDFNTETNDRKSIIMTLIKGPKPNPDIG